jgi:pimeloyl-ACP methyl ester carboxylesterase
MHRVQTGGGGKVVVGFHGWSGDHRTFQPLLENLPEAILFYSYDLPGCGQTPEPPHWEIREVAQSLANELVELKKENLTLVGSCTGGLMAVFVARELTEMGRGSVVGRLVMIDPFAECPWYFRLFLIPVLGRIMYSTAFANPLGRWMTNLMLREKRAENVNLTESFAQVNHRVTLAYLRMFERAGAPEQFRNLKIPTEIICGERTFGAVKQAVERWRRVFPEARVHVLHGVGHLPIDEGTEMVELILFAGAGERKTPKTKKLSAQKARELREWRNELTRGDSVGS